MNHGLPVVRTEQSKCKGPEVGGAVLLQRHQGGHHTFRKARGPMRSLIRSCLIGHYLRNLALTRVNQQLLEGGREEACHLTSVPRISLVPREKESRQDLVVTLPGFWQWTY